MDERQPMQESDHTTRWSVLEVHNFGGFFGGDTVTLTTARWSDGTQETITIDEKALANVRERHLVAPSMVFDLQKAGKRVDRAELLGAADWPLLDTALGAAPSQGRLDGPRVRAYHCERCGLWVIGEPVVEGTIRRCRLCDIPI